MKVEGANATVIRLELTRWGITNGTKIRRRGRGKRTTRRKRRIVKRGEATVAVAA